MSKEILDDDLWSKRDIRNLQDVKDALIAAGITSFFEHKDGYIIVEEGEAVKVEVHFDYNEAIVKTKFPTIGNSIQVFSSIAIVSFFIWGIAIPFPLPWPVGILLGQLISYGVYTPKTKRLKERIERFI
ncbi:MAG: hypothetical protein AB8F78_14245 [Saprospiraceae bacterium]